MVNPVEQDIKEFIRSGAVLKDGDGLYWLLQDPVKVDREPDSGPSFLIQNFFGKAQRIIGRKYLSLPYKEFSLVLEKFEGVPPCEVKKYTPEDSFQKMFAEIKTKIQQGTLEKCVPFAEEILQLKNLVDYGNKIYLLKNFLAHSESTGSFLYGFWNEGSGFIGSSPEILFKKTGNQVETMALAGTRSNENQPETLLSDPKERAEHQFVIDGIKNSLSEFGNVCVGKTELMRLAAVTHLFTPINLQMEITASLSDLMAALHPTAALGGSPRSTSWEILKRFEEQVPRENFGAPFVMEARGNSFGVVMIRGIRWQKNKVIIPAGCGVVGQSSYEKEWQEVLLKIASIKKAGGIC